MISRYPLRWRRVWELPPGDRCAVLSLQFRCVPAPGPPPDRPGDDAEGFLGWMAEVGPPGLVQWPGSADGHARDCAGRYRASV